jgi:hypothetical protein
MHASVHSSELLEHTSDASHAPHRCIALRPVQQCAASNCRTCGLEMFSPIHELCTRTHSQPPSANLQPSFPEEIEVSGSCTATFVFNPMQVVAPSQSRRHVYAEVSFRNQKEIRLPILSP